MVFVDISISEKRLKGTKMETKFNLVMMQILQWIIDRKFKEGASLVMQQVKGEEELKELFVAIIENNLPEAIDGIGDSLVVLMAQCEISGADWRKVFNMDNAVLEKGIPPTSAIVACQLVHGDMARVIAKNRPIEELENVFFTYFQALVQLADSLNIAPERCAEQAYNEIKDRKGEWVNGSWVKEADLPHKA